MNKRKTTIILVAFFVLLTAVFMAFSPPVQKFFKNWGKNHTEPLAILQNSSGQNQKVQAFSFTDQTGRTITNDDVKGKVYVAEYFFATCKGICPRMNEHMNKVYKAHRGNKDFMILSHTVDPEQDSAAALAAYAKTFEADPAQWKFLTGDKKKLYETARYSYLISAEDDTSGLSVDEDFIHDKHFVLVDRDGYLRGRFYDGLDTADVSRLITDIGNLLNEK